MSKYAIIGFGCAGYHAARQLRKYCRDAEIDVFEKTEHGGANPMLTTYYTEGKIGFQQMFPFGDMHEICRELDLTLISGYVLRVRTDTKEVYTADGASRRYDKILISTGASALLPPFITADSGEVFLMRTIRDAEALKNRLEGNAAKTAIVIGASMTGIKVAEVLHSYGIRTSLLDAAGRVFPTSAYPCVAGKIASALEEKGLRLMMGIRISEVTPEGVILDDGTLLNADIVCLSVGTRANTELVANTEVVAGQTVHIDRGIIVDARMETSCPGIYAAGDCCEGIDLQTGKTMIIGLWANAAVQGECAGRNMAGMPMEYQGSIFHNITRFFGMTFAGMGDPDAPGEMRSFRRDGVDVHAVTDSGRIMSINILGGCEISGVLKSLLIKRLYKGRGGLSMAQRGILKDAGLPREFIEYLGAQYHEAEYRGAQYLGGDVS